MIRHLYWHYGYNREFGWVILNIVGLYPIIEEKLQYYIDLGQSLKTAVMNVRTDYDTWFHKGDSTPEPYPYVAFQMLGDALNQPWNL